MADWARGFGDYVAAIAGGAGVALIAALILLALSRVTLPSLRRLWRRASPLGRLFGTLLFLICSINATTKAPTRTAPKRIAATAVSASQSQPTRITFPTTPREAVELFIGPYTVAVTNAGDYVFLLEKGLGYNFGTRPFIADVTYSAVDDFGTANNVLRSASGWQGTTWSTDGGGLEWTLPTEAKFGSCCWLPYFKGAPDLPYLSSDAFPSVFEGVLSDAVEGLSASYEWRTNNDNLEIKSPNERETEVVHKDGTDWQSYNLAVTATLGEHKLTSTINGHFWTNSVVEETSLTVSAPKALLLPSNAVKEGRDSGVVTVDLKLPEGESGTLSLECVSGSGKVQLTGKTSWEVNGSTTKEVLISGKDYSNNKDDVRLIASFNSRKNESITSETSLSVLKVWHEAIAFVPEDNLRKCFGIAEKALVIWKPNNFGALLQF